MPPAPTLCLVLQGHRILEGGVHVQPHSDNRNSKIALVQFESAAEAARALVSGGGRPDMAQSGGPDGSRAQAALTAIEQAIRAAKAA